MYAHRYNRLVIIVCCVCLLLFSSACQDQASAIGQKRGSQEQNERAVTLGMTPTVGTSPVTQIPTPTPTPKPTAPPKPTATATPVPTTGTASGNSNRPVLAFYYPWYSPSTWCSCQMSDLPTIQYTSSDSATISRQLTWAMQAGISGFISSWWGPGDATDKNLATLLTLTPKIAASTGSHFASSIYFESDSPAFTSESGIVSGLQYMIAHYSSSPYFFHWNGKPVLFFWDPLGHGRTLAEWAAIRSQVDPNNQMIWSAEGVDMSLLSVFDGIHLFSGGYWGLQQGDMAAVDQGFRAKIDAYNQANNTQKIWAAGIIPGYNDTLVPGRTGTYIVPRNNGATYSQGWTGAIASNPDWITITSFNEWFEGSMIEPSVTYGMLYLNLTQQYAQQWRNGS